MNPIPGDVISFPSMKGAAEVPECGIVIESPLVNWRLVDVPGVIRVEVHLDKITVVDQPLHCRHCAKALTPAKHPVSGKWEWHDDFRSAPARCANAASLTHRPATD